MANAGYDSMASLPRITESVALSVSTKIQGLWAVDTLGAHAAAATIHKRTRGRNRDSAMKFSKGGRGSILEVRFVITL